MDERMVEWMKGHTLEINYIKRGLYEKHVKYRYPKKYS